MKTKLILITGIILMTLLLCGTGSATDSELTPITGTINQGKVVFENSPIITDMKLPGNSSGTVNINTEHSNLPENGWYGFTLDISGYDRSSSIPGEINYQIPIAVLKTNNYGLHDIVLFQYEDGKWVKIATVFLNEDGTNAYYRSFITGDGIYCIGFEKGEAREISEPTPISTPQPETPKSPFPILGIMLGFSAAAVFGLRKS